MAQNSLCLGYNRPTSTALDDVRLLPNTSMPCNPFLHANFSTSFRGIGKPIGESNVVKRRQVVVPRAASGSTAHSVREFVLKDFRARRALKIISGLQNFNKDSVASVVIAAERGGATHVDIACDAKLVKLALSLTRLPVCVSAVEPESFLVAVEAGAHMVEIGNYDSFYEARRKFSSTEILHLTKRTRHLLPSVIMSVTVPHTLTLADQVRLAELLEIEGTDIIQTEGGASSEPSRSGVHGLIEKV